MKKLDPNSMRELTEPEVRQRLRDLKKEMFDLKFRLSSQKPDNPLRIRMVRRDVAIAATVLREHELGIRKLRGQQ